MWHADTHIYTRHTRRSYAGMSIRNSARDGGNSTPGDLLFRGGIYTLVALLLVALLLAALDWGLQAGNFPVKNVRFEGRFRHVTQQQLEQAVHEYVRGNFLTVDLSVIKERVESLPWVYQASVRRNWSRDITIRISEQKLAARWGADAWLNHAGEVVRVDAPEATEKLPRLEGPDGAHAQVLRHYSIFGRMVEPLGREISELKLSARRTWSLRLDNGVVLILGRDGPEKKMERFVRQYEKSLGGSAEDIARVDLRYTNGFSVQWKRTVNAGGRNH